MTAGDVARVMVVVETDPATAFAVFTEETDLWWRRGPQFRIGGTSPGTIAFEPRAGGRLFESYATDAGERVREIGTILAWEPPARLVFEWRNANFAPAEVTEVEVRFERARRGTRVTIEHRGWAALRPDHPARHGLDAPAFVAMLGMWWSDLLTGLRVHARRD
jgi:uncharacterized protein YndB with AHSA1/START domain